MVAMPCRPPADIRSACVIGAGHGPMLVSKFSRAGAPISQPAPTAGKVSALSLPFSHQFPAAAQQRRKREEATRPFSPAAWSGATNGQDVGRVISAQAMLWMALAIRPAILRHKLHRYILPLLNPPAKEHDYGTR